MTLEDIKSISKPMLVVEDICGYLGADPNTVRWQAQNEPEKLGFPVIVAKSRVKIPKDGFIFFCQFGRPIKTVKEGTYEPTTN